MSSDPSFHCALLLALLVATYSGATALECYECNSHTDSRCKDNVPPTTMKQKCNELTSGSKYTFCRKIFQQVEFSVNGMPPDTRIVRSCGWDESKYQGQCYDRSGLGGTQTVCSCYSDNCNGSPSSRYSLSLGDLLLSIIPALFANMIVS